MIRRSFIGLSARMTCGFTAPMLCTKHICAQERTKSAAGDDSIGPFDASYLQQGLNALARAHHMSSMAGHLGASMIAAYFVGKQRESLSPEVITGIKADMAKVLRGDSVFGKKMSRQSKLSDAQLFEPFPKQQPDPTLIDGIADGLEKGIDKPRQSGHNVIFASLAISALREHPELATPSVVDGIRKLMRLFATQTPGSGYYGKAKGRIKGDKIQLPENDDTPVYDTLEDMAETVLDETIKQNPKMNRVGYGGLVHIINHCAAIVSLSDHRYDDLAQRAIQAHRQHLRLWRNLPNVADEQGPLKQSKFTPHEEEYWTSGEVPYDRALLTHRVKTMYGFDELVTAVDKPEKEKAAYSNLRFLM